MKKKTYVILGGAGFIGHNLALKLSENPNNLIYIFDDLSVNNLFAKKYRKKNNFLIHNRILTHRLKLIKKNNIKFYRFNINSSYKKIEKKLLRIKPNFIFHLAAVSHANISNIDPFYTYENSVNTLMRILEIVKSLNSHLIYLSSSMVYGNFNGKVVSENTTCKPLGIYGNLKLMCENIIKAYKQVFDINYTIVRPSALYGERCISMRVGQIFLENAVQGKKIVINGNGKEKLDFTYIEDFISGLIKITKAKNSRGQTYNLTFGNGRQINSLIDILKKEFTNLKVYYEKRDKLMPKRGTLSILKAKKQLNFNPKFPVEKGYLKYIRWYKKFIKI